MIRDMYYVIDVSVDAEAFDYPVLTVNYENLGGNYSLQHGDGKPENVVITPFKIAKRATLHDVINGPDPGHTRQAKV